MNSRRAILCLSISMVVVGLIIGCAKERESETVDPLYSLIRLDTLDWMLEQPPENPEHLDQWTAYFGPNAVPVEMIYVAPGTFLQGSPESDTSANEFEFPQHEVIFDHGYWLAKYELTQEQYKAVVPREWTFSMIGDDRPVEGVSWRMIREYFLRELNEHDSTGTPWRMPSESEWEYAARAGTDTRFPWGDDWNYEQLGDYAWYIENSDTGNGPETHPYGRKRPNRWDFYDMFGNVAEYCDDDHHVTYIDAPADGGVWPRESIRHIPKVVRGGSWNCGPWCCRVACRGLGDDYARNQGVGVRLARDE